MRFGIYRRVRRRRAGRRRRRRLRGPDLLREAGRRAADLFFRRHAGRAKTIRGLTIIDRIVRPGAVFRRINTKRMLIVFISIIIIFIAYQKGVKQDLIHYCNIYGLMVRLANRQV